MAPTGNGPIHDHGILPLRAALLAHLDRARRTAPVRTAALSPADVDGTPARGSASLAAFRLQALRASQSGTVFSAVHRRRTGSPAQGPLPQPRHGAFRD